jgi:hypothetical protein
LQEKQIDREGERFAASQTLRPVNGYETPLQAGKIMQAEAIADACLGVSEGGEFRDGGAESGHIGIVDKEAGSLGRRLNHTLIYRGSIATRPGPCSTQRETRYAIGS